jgi:hypothetical protein
LTEKTNSIQDRLAAAIESQWEFSERERELLALAEGQLRDLERLEADIAEHGIREAGGGINRP